MWKLIKAENGMNIMGQGGKIILFTLPALAAALILHFNFPQIAALPFSGIIVSIIGYVLAAFGGILWLAAAMQLVINFPKGKLVTTGAYGVCRNPIYSSVALFILPAVCALCGTWVYLLPSVFLCIGVRILIKKEEETLFGVFGQEYGKYTARVSRLVPFLRPGKKDVYNKRP